MRLRPRAGVYLAVTGLPAGTRELEVRLDGAGARLLRPRRVGPDRCRSTSSARITGQRASITAPGGTVTGICPR